MYCFSFSGFPSSSASYLVLSDSDKASSRFWARAVCALPRTLCCGTGGDAGVACGVAVGVCDGVAVGLIGGDRVAVAVGATVTLAVVVALVVGVAVVVVAASAPLPFLRRWAR